MLQQARQAHVDAQLACKWQDRTAINQYAQEIGANPFQTSSCELSTLKSCCSGGLCTPFLAMLAGAGVPILKALQAAAETLSNHAMRADALDALLLVPVFVARRTSS